MALSPVTVNMIAQEIPVGYAVPLSHLFTTFNAEGLPITDYMIKLSGSALISLNNAADLATPAQITAGEIVVSASDLAKLTIQPTATSGIPTLAVSAYDGVNWSAVTNEALTITTNPTAMSATPGLVMIVGSSIAATSLYTVSGYLGPSTQTGYTFDPAPAAGAILGNGAYNMAANSPYAGTFWVSGTEVGFLTYQAPATPGYVNFVEQVWPGGNGPWSDWEQVNVTVTGPATTVAVEIQNAAANKPLYAAFVSDSAVNVFANLDALQANLSAGILYGIAVTDTVTPVEQITAAQFLQDRGAIALISGAYSLSVSGMTAAQAAGLMAPATLTHLTSMTVTDSAADIFANLDALQSVIQPDHLSALIVTDSGTPQIALNAAQMAKDGAAVSLLSGNYSLSVTGSAAVVSTVLDGLETQAAKGALAGVTLTDGATPNLSLSAAQLTSDAQALGEISGAYTLTVSAGIAPVNIAGLSGHATTVQFGAGAIDYTVTAANGVITVTSGTVTDSLIGIAALQFTDFTEIVAAAPSSSGAPTTGNVTELYAGVLGREPDVAGLGFYQSYLQKNPSTPLLQFAEWFLFSSEYTANPAHSYAQSTAGETQFIVDSYQNLLRRAPTASEISFYLSNVLEQPGSQLQNHAQMLVYFSASAEFLADVQITAAHQVSASHWLLLA